MKLSPWSYSMLNNYDVCPRRWHHMYWLKDLPREEKSEAQTYGDRVHDAMKSRLRIGKELPDEFKACEPLAAQVVGAKHTMHVEVKLGAKWDGDRVVSCDFFDPDVWGRGTIDVALLNGSDALVLDWKTGKVREDPKELELQAMLLRIKHPSLTRITGHYVWLKENRVGQRFDLSDFAGAYRYVQKTLKEIEGRLERNDWPPDEGPLCGYCPVPKDKCEWRR
jgi:CRISPR/Cas system-associated exonuclease Cas4 (RecB family)